MIVYIIKKESGYRIIDTNGDYMEHCGFATYADAKEFAARRGWRISE